MRDAISFCSTHLVECFSASLPPPCTSVYVSRAFLFYCFLLRSCLHGSILGPVFTPSCVVHVPLLANLSWRHCTSPLSPPPCPRRACAAGPAPCIGAWPTPRVPSVVPVGFFLVPSSGTVPHLRRCIVQADVPALGYRCLSVSSPSFPSLFLSTPAHRLRSGGACLPHPRVLPSTLPPSLASLPCGPRQAHAHTYARGRDRRTRTPHRRPSHQLLALPVRNIFGCISFLTGPPCTTEQGAPRCVCGCHHRYVAHPLAFPFYTAHVGAQARELARQGPTTAEERARHCLVVPFSGFSFARHLFSHVQPTTPAPIGPAGKRGGTGAGPWRSYRFCVCQRADGVRASDDVACRVHLRRHRRTR